MIPHIAVILTDADRRIIWVNDDFTAITGYQASEVIGRKPSLLQGPDSEPEAIQRIRENLNAQNSFSDLITNYRKNGEAYPCRLTIHPIYDEGQDLTNFIAFEVDGDQVQDIDRLSLLQVSDRYQTSSLKGVDEVKLYSRLRQLLIKEKLYLEPSLTLRSVADRLGTNTKYLSQVVNHYSGNHFQFFINNYRIEEVKRKIISEDFENFTLYGIALQCGFKNKSTFYKVFKEITGQTPREYLLRYKERNQE